MKVAILGGGINSIQIAKSLINIGIEVDIFEKSLICSETSIKSSRLLHGGIRYLENFQFNFVAESLKCRSLWQEQYREETQSYEFIIPIFKFKSKNIFYLFAGVKLYELLSGKHKLGSGKIRNKRDTLNLNLGLKKDNLIGSVSYYDLKMNDKEIIKKIKSEIVSSGVKIHENMAIEEFDNKGNLKIGKNWKKFNFIINACGSWSEDILKRNKIESNFSLKHVRGSHLIINKQISKPLVMQNMKDNRIIFLIPEGKYSLLGTTEIEDKNYEKLVCSDSERDYLIKIYNDFFQDQISHKDVVDSFSGYRPIVNKRSNKNISKASREEVIEKTDKLITIFGGKWTSSNIIGDKVLKLIT